ncbi:transposase [Streptomyces sp. 1222.5]|uniref:transposase n=1 Tax=Streptomyces sp. 1222.5 TaxID=1881026 RepID=UPI003F4A7B78
MWVDGVRDGSWRGQVCFPSYSQRGVVARWGVGVGKRRNYDAEFREGAVRIVLETGKPAAEVARDLGTRAAELGRQGPGRSGGRRSPGAVPYAGTSWQPSDNTIPISTNFLVRFSNGMSRWAKFCLPASALT